jgi:predicted dehydrogenase
MSTPLAWGILGTGAIARTFARGLAHAHRGRLVAVGSRTAEKARVFAAEFGNVNAHGSYEALLADPAVQAVYVAVPHPDHAAWTIRAAEAGKHILCEKPLGLNHAEGMVMTEAARVHNVLLMEAFMYRCSPQTARIVELVRSGMLGEIKVIQATFSFRAGFDPEKRLFKNALGGGGILDVGGYPVSFARLVAGAAEGRAFADPIEVKGCAALNPVTGVDDHAAATLTFASGIVAQVATGVTVAQDNSARIYGTEAWLHVMTPWIPAKEGGAVTMYLHRYGGGEPELVTVETTDWLYALEADAVAAALASGAREVPQMSIADTLGNLAALDAWRQSAGLTYEAEKPENYTRTIARRPLAVRASRPIPRGNLPGLEKPVSRLVMGCDNQRTMPHAVRLRWWSFRTPARLVDAAPRCARRMRRHRQGRTYAALPAGVHRPAAQRKPRASADRSRRPLHHAPRQP